MIQPDIADTYDLQNAALAYLVDATPSLPHAARQLVARRCSEAVLRSRPLAARGEDLAPYANWRWPELETELAASGTPWQGPTHPVDELAGDGYELKLLARLEREGASTLEDWLRHFVGGPSLGHICTSAGLPPLRSAEDKAEALITAMATNAELHGLLASAHENCRARAANRAEVKRENIAARSKLRHLDVLEEQTLLHLKVVAAQGAVPLSPSALAGLQRSVMRARTSGRPFSVAHYLAEAQGYMACVSNDRARTALLSEFVQAEVQRLTMLFAIGNIRPIFDLMQPDEVRVNKTCARCAGLGVSRARSAIQAPPFSPLCKCADVVWLKGGKRLDEQWQVRFVHWALSDYCGEFVPALWLSLLQSPRQTEAAKEPAEERPKAPAHQAKQSARGNRRRASAEMRF